MLVRRWPIHWHVLCFLIRHESLTQRTSRVAMNGIFATSDSFSVGDIPRSIEFEPFKILDHLINRWCERRALRPLRYLLDGYPGVLAHTDQQFELVEALKKVNALCRDDLTQEERHFVR